MINQDPLHVLTNASATSEENSIDMIVQSGPRGALTIAGIATAVVIALWFAFYFFVFLPRGAI